MAFATLFVFQPLGGWAAEGIGYAATEAVSRGGAFTGFVLGGLFLPLVMLGVHQGLTPIHAQLIAQYGYTILLPILARRRGTGGSCSGSLCQTRGSPDPESGGLRPASGFPGVGEPLIYGVTLPWDGFHRSLHRGACGGAVQAAFQVGAAALGISGLPLAPSTTNVPCTCWDSWFPTQPVSRPLGCWGLKIRVQSEEKKHLTT